jgi:hypothetical protein
VDTGGGRRNDRVVQGTKGACPVPLTNTSGANAATGTRNEGYAELRIANVCISQVVAKNVATGSSDADPFLPTESLVT